MRQLDIGGVVATERGQCAVVASAPALAVKVRLMTDSS